MYAALTLVDPHFCTKCGQGTFLIDSWNLGKRDNLAYVCEPCREKDNGE